MFLEILYYIVNFYVYLFEQKVIWVGVLKNFSKLFNFIFFLYYCFYKVFNYIVVWSKEFNCVNVFFDVFLNIIVSFNFFGMFNLSINVIVNVIVYNYIFLWYGYVSNMSIVFNLMLWNCIIEFVIKICNVF